MHMPLNEAEEPSINKAMFLAKRSNEQITHKTGKKSGTSRQSFMKYRDEFSSVAHLHAAFLQEKAINSNGQMEWPENIESVEIELPKIFAISEKYREFGEKFFPPTCKKS